ncbi:hypothetical protein [Paracoccus sp. Ld10]|uniref:hypothetical protein n=1 Tax=Paracoccus sp. Ld10 TaxID=649158 RepID=UPI00386364AC
MANSRSDRSLSNPRAPKASVRPDASVLRTDAKPKPKPTAVSRANEIVRAIGLRPITGLSGPKIGY